MTPAELSDLLDATWPAASLRRVGPWTIREGRGGGKRVSAATADADWHPSDLPAAEAAMQALGQRPLFRVRADEDTLDAALEAAGYGLVDPVTAYAAPVETLTGEPPSPMAAFPHWPPLGIVRDLWAEGGLGPERVAVMDRVAGPKCAILGRWNDRAAGGCFVALHGTDAMVHALEVTPALRRQGAGRVMLGRAACWAAEQGARRFSLVVTSANLPARALYASLGLQDVGSCHYRLK